MNSDLILKKFWELNPQLKCKSEEIRDNYCTRSDGRLEWVCLHGVGHTIYSPRGISDSIHGCDGCCKDIKFVTKL